MKKIIIITTLMVSLYSNANNEPSYYFGINKEYYKNAILIERDNSTPITPICGSAHNSSFNNAPENNLCHIGNHSEVILESNQFNWSCSENNTQVNCNAQKIIAANPVCGSAHNSSFEFTPTNYLCEIGTSSNVVLNSTIFNWTCNEENNSVSCNAEKINNPPQCGTAHLQNLSIIPENNLCEVGNSTVVTTSGNKFEWSCEKEEYTSQSCYANNTAALYSSCKELLTNRPDLLNQNGVYPLRLGGINTTAYCNMTNYGGGWTLVAAQFEDDTVPNWNEGIQSDYDPSLVSKKGFTLNTSQIPTHTTAAFTQTDSNGFSIPRFYNFVYSTGNINANMVGNDGFNYTIHRNTGGFYSQCKVTSGYITNNISWNNTLMIERANAFSYCFAPKPVGGDSKQLGYSYGPYAGLASSKEYGAWTIWVK